MFVFRIIKKDSKKNIIAGIFFTGFVVCALLVAQIGMAMVEQVIRVILMRKNRGRYKDQGIALTLSYDCAIDS